MDAISPAIGRSVTVTPGGVQTVTPIPGRSIFQLASAAISVVGATNHYLGAAGTFDNFEAGDIVDVLGFTDPANNGRKRVVSVSATGTQLFVSDTGLNDEAAGDAVTFTRLRLPRAVMVLATTNVPKMNLWHCDGGAPPAAVAAFYVGTTPLLLDSFGFSTFVIDGASGSVCLTPIENA